MKQRSWTHENKENEDTRSNKDMLSDLPDSVLMHILSFLQTKESVQTCLLSTRWKHLWKYLPTLTLNSDHIRTVKSFTEFVNQVLALRDASTAVYALDYLASFVDSDLPQRVVRYAVSHNVNRLRLSCYTHQFPPSLFSCLSLTSLDISLGFRHEFPNSLNLPALNYLKLRHFCFCGANDGRTEPFSTFNKLSTLILSNCIVPMEQTLCISSTTLLSLSINRCFSISKLELSSPNLCSFTFTGKHFPKLCGSSLDSIKKATIVVKHMDMVPHHVDTPLILLNGLIELVNIKSLIVSTTTLQVLSLIPDILKVSRPSWNSLKSLKVKSDRRNRIILSMFREMSGWEERLEIKRLELYSSIPDGIIEFLLQNSPSVKVD